MFKAEISDLMTLFGRDGLKKASHILRPQVGMHHNALLRKDEWLELDKIVLETAKTELNGVQDLVSAGLVKKLGGLGSKVSAYERIGEMTAANVSMSIDVPGEKDRLEYDLVNVPIPVIYKDFAFDLRDLQAARQSGDPLETDHVAAATRVVTESMESILFSGSSVQLGGYTIQGYTNKTGRIADTAGNFGGGDWGTAGNAYKTLRGMLDALRAIGFRGPFMAYAASTQYGQTLNYFDTTNPQSEKSVILQNMPEIRDIKPSFELSDGVCVLVQMTGNVVDLAVGFSLAPVSWAEMGGMVTQYRVMTAVAPRVKADANVHVGLAHASGC
jgi:uncharacterized linocin/CFP29 family protein